jgi:hypothetical protein
MGILEKIQDIEREMARTQKNKGACGGGGCVGTASSRAD